MPHRKTRTSACERLIALVDVAERLVHSARRRGAPNLTPYERKILDYWLSERDELERSARGRRRTVRVYPATLRERRGRLGRNAG